MKTTTGAISRAYPVIVKLMKAQGLKAYTGVRLVRMETELAPLYRYFRGQSDALVREYGREDDPGCWVATPAEMTAEKAESFLRRYREITEEPVEIHAETVRLPADYVGLTPEELAAAEGFVEVQENNGE